MSDIGDKLAELLPELPPDRLNELTVSIETKLAEFAKYQEDIYMEIIGELMSAWIVCQAVRFADISNAGNDTAPF